ncbi:MAG: HAD family hydrolase, partial [Actinomycetota bacterium]
MMVAGGSIEIGGEAVVVLDVDDTLYLEASYVRSGFDAVGRHLVDSLGLDGVGRTLWSNFELGVRGDAFDRAVVAHGLEPSAALIAELVEVYRTHRPTIELLPDAEDFLHRIKGMRTAVITDGPGESQRQKVAALGLDRFVDLIIITDELGDGFSKPHHRAFAMVEKTFGAPPDRHIYIGDNPFKDFIAPQERGWGS